MRLTTRVDDVRQLTICLGRQTENNVTEIAFDVSAWINEFGNGTTTILLQRPTDSAAAPVLTTMDGNVAYHALTNGDLQYVGEGQTQVIFTINGKIKKSRVFNTRILESLNNSGTAPSPWQSWVDQVLEAAEDAEDAKDDAVEAKDDAVTAKNAAVTAQTAAETAETNAETARDSAITAKNAAVTAKESAESSAQSASSSASSASASATNASNSATAASGSASAAAESAEDADDSADRAEEATTKNPYIDATTQNWFVWNATTQQWVNTGVKAKGEKGDTGTFDSVTAEVDANTGTPSVDVNYTSPGSVKFKFHNIKGEKGNKGDTGEKGDTGTFNSVEATVDANIGTPEVDVTYEEGDVEFAFKNLKGQKGDKGDPGLTDDDRLFSFAVNSNGHLIVTATSETFDDYTFTINSSGHLIMSHEEV